MGQKVPSTSLRLEKTNRHFDSCWYTDLFYSHAISREFALRNLFNTVLRQIGNYNGHLSVLNLPKRVIINFFWYRQKKNQFLEELLGNHTPLPAEQSYGGGRRGRPKLKKRPLPAERSYGGGRRGRPKLNNPFYLFGGDSPTPLLPVGGWLTPVLSVDGLSTRYTAVSRLLLHVAWGGLSPFLPSVQTGQMAAFSSHNEQGRRGATSSPARCDYVTRPSPLSTFGTRGINPRTFSFTYHHTALNYCTRKQTANNKIVTWSHPPHLPKVQKRGGGRLGFYFCDRFRFVPPHLPKVQKRRRGRERQPLTEEGRLSVERLTNGEQIHLLRYLLVTALFTESESGVSSKESLLYTVTRSLSIKKRGYPAVGQLRGLLRSHNVSRRHPTKPALKYLQLALSNKLHSHVALLAYRSRRYIQSSLLFVEEMVYYLKRGLPPRKTIRHLLWKVPLVVRGVRVTYSGCFRGQGKRSQRANTECVKLGETPLNALSSRVDFACKSVSTRSGLVGVKVWICYR